MSTVLTEKRDAIGIITINRPAQLNSLDSATRRGIADACKVFEADPDVRVVVVRGAEGKAFVAGADIAEFAATETLTYAVMHDEWQFTDVIAALRLPVIAMIDGFCLGGGMELAMACDLRFASDRSRFGQPEINLGIIPGAGGTQRLPRLAGEGKAMEMILTGDMVGAADAERFGIVNAAVPAEELEARVMKLAGKIATKSPYTLARAKAAVKATAERPLGDGLRYEQEMFVECFNSADGKEGVAAFLEKRKPAFKGA